MGHVGQLEYYLLEVAMSKDALIGVMMKNNGGWKNVNGY